MWKLINNRWMFIELMKVGEVVNFIFSYLQCKTLLKIWWGQYNKRINIIFFIFGLSNPPVHTLRKSDTPISPQNAHYMAKN